ncbi:ribosomal protein S18-alanine N-acetyltransferase [Mycobacteroides franklinii]|uniref:[Ribosomal protein bS18]-alanine N-acetyltransferase n=1 Tax=Mycobacteroides franklinii TaxID=948102 RepID=A0A4R5PAP7_9MYCO|nr:ribosomal protein S18-alanine N-acetyltransferase [Mycobacteroides franklinii]ORA59033.1 ribosomal-protein-alanine N-acetyltransferase [Mycobacteroides franklinii]TDH21799.1 ribosomal-protein-alanine N-acetyltransferase [Mycobacteroides franklinii]TDZ43363.1 ribosomal-protein-alanine N-acetyltransferase [Mycobacteroides franklinii]TDZ50498.1 ribosomal-protein-alanine N-acetyltransferase [Mycobacteroides franklinii]TDZ56918.1 ribosomal-protein-alanine N-acetyltransferase [Mycobacteroides fra
MTIELGPLRRRDARRCAELEAILFQGDDPWPESAFRSELAAAHVFYLAARDGRTLVGYGGISRLGHQEPEYEIHTIGVDLAYQKQGLGRRLLDALLAHADQDPGPVFLEVRTDNEAAIALYHGTGFETVGLRKRYYPGSGADAFTMKRPAHGIVK